MDSSLSSVSVRSYIPPSLIPAKDFYATNLRDKVHEQVDEALENRVTKKVQANWQDFTTIEKWKAYFDGHPEWHGKGTGGITKIEGRVVFYASFNNWCKKESKGNKAERKRLIEIIFPPLRNSWDFTRIAEWKAHFDDHPEWHEKGTDGIAKIEGGRAFYRAFSRWCKKESKGNKAERKRLIEIIFPPLRNSWDFTRIAKWKAHFDDHPEWHGKSTDGITEIEGGTNFYQAFSTWCRKESKEDEVERKRLIEIIFPPLLSSWDFTTIEEWKAHFDDHPEWHGQGTGRIQKQKIEGGNAFYQSFSRWCKKESKGNKAERKRLIEIIFPPLLSSWNFTTIEEWKSHFDEHPEWSEQGTEGITKIEGGRAFYQAFSTWCRKESKEDEVERKRLIEIIFPSLYNSWNFTTIEEWKSHFDEHPEWHGKGTGGIQKQKIEGGVAFYASFSNWCKKESKEDEVERKRLIEIIFPSLYNSWDFTTIEEWKSHFDEHPEWHGKGTGGITKIEGGSAFYSAFSKWCRKESNGDDVEKRRLVEIIFPIRGYKCSFQFDDGNMCTFDSHPERITGILLHSLGMIKKFEEGRNLHIRTNGSKQHSIDFKVGDVFLEYHPVSILEWKKGMDFNDAAKRKHDHITNPKYLHRANLYVFDEIDTLYDIILNDSELRFYVRYPYFGPDFGKKEWNALVSEVYRKVNEYDKANPRKKK